MLLLYFLFPVCLKKTYCNNCEVIQFPIPKNAFSLCKVSCEIGTVMLLLHGPLLSASQV